MKKVYYLVFSILCLFSFSIVFAENEIVIKSITPVYDEDSSVVVTEEENSHSVIFNDKNQSVKYNVVIENNADYDVKVNSIELTTPTEEFLIYEVEGIKQDDVLKSNETEELIVSLETIQMDGWGRNFDDKLITNISFDEVKLTMPEQIIDSVTNPETNDFIFFVIGITCIGGLGILLVKKNKFSRHFVLVITLASILQITKAQDTITINLEIYTNFESQNVMQRAYDDGESMVAYWDYGHYIKNIYIQNEFYEIATYEYKFDVSERQNGKVVAYLLSNEEYSNYYDLYLQADGVIYFNSDATWYFAFMKNLDSINNLESIDTSNVTNMYEMFYQTGYNSTIFTLDVSNFDTSNVTSMKRMFSMTGYNSTKLNTSITISNPNTTSYFNMFNKVATQDGSKITVNYTSETSDLVDKMIATKSSNSNVVKGVQVD